MRSQFGLLLVLCLAFLLGSSVYAEESKAKQNLAGNKVKAENLFIEARDLEASGKQLEASNTFLQSFLQYPHPTIMYEHLRLAYLSEQYHLVQNTGLKFLATKPDISKRLGQSMLDMIASAQEFLQYEINLVDEEKLNAPSNDGAKMPQKLDPYRIHTNIFDIERSQKMVAPATAEGSNPADRNDSSNVVKAQQDRQAKIFERHNASINRSVERLKALPSVVETTNRYNVKLIAAKGEDHLILNKDRNGNWQLRKINELKPLRLTLLDDSNNNNKGKPYLFLIGDEGREQILSIDLKNKEIRYMNQLTREKTTYKILGFE